MYDNCDKISDGILIKLHVLPDTKFHGLQICVCVDLVSSYCTKTCCQMSSTCLQNFKIYVLPQIKKYSINLKNIYRFCLMDN